MTEGQSIGLTVVCAAVCFVLGLFYFRLRNPLHRIICHVVAPFVLGMSAYWILNWNWRHEPAYKGWDMIFTMQVMVVAIPASAIAAALSWIMRKWIIQHPPA